MLRKIYLILVAVCISSLAVAQTGTLKGVVTDVMSGEPIPFANIIIEKNGNQSGGTMSDFDGNYTIKPIDPGSYTVKATFVGYGTVEITKVVISANKITFQNVQLQEGIALGEVKVIEYKKPLIDQDNLSGETKTSEEIVALPTRSVSSVAATTAGIYQEDEGGSLNVRGSRSDATEYYIDGIKVRGALGVPTTGIEQITVVTGGLPARYGDATGGVISVTTKGPSNKFGGGIEYETSSLFDTYHYNLLGYSLSGPILKKKNSDGSKGSSILGYFISGELRSIADADPSAVGIWKVKDSKLDDLKENPFRLSENGSGFKNNARWLTSDDLENVQAKPNAQNKRFNITAKLDFKPAKNTNFSLGGSYYARENRNFSRWRSLLSSTNNSLTTENTYRIFGKLTQKFGSEESSEESSSSTIKNAFFTIQGDYTNYKETYSDAEHLDKVFHYGYVGKFKTYKAPVYERFTNDGQLIVVYDTIINPNGDTSALTYTGEIQQGWQDTLYQFTPSDINIDLANYTQSFYDMYKNNPSFVNSPDGIIRSATDPYWQGLRNGSTPPSIYSLFGNVGAWYGYSTKEEKTQTSFKATGSADIKSHEVSFGFEFEQRNDSYWQFNAWRNIWSLMRLQANKHIQERDLANPNALYVDGVYQGVVDYDRQYNAEEQSYFDRSLREKLNKPIDGTEWLDIDNYDPSTYTLDLFSPDELLNDGNNYVLYYGYDIYGNKLTTNPTLDQFFNEKDDNGIYKREIRAFQPIYTAGYIQDKFAIEDLIFNIGLRIDRYDANQKVLKDKYSLYETFTRGSDGAALIDNAGYIPSTIGDDWVVYVNDAFQPTSIVGYRDGDSWYDASGTPISDPSILAEAAGGSIAPYIVNSEAAKINQIGKEAFEDYAPEVVFMPRIAFSFPISDEAQFFAHYDVLTQRPPTGSRLNPIDYLYWVERATDGRFNNPNLKPEKTVEYELGFVKKLSLRSAINISAFYKELRDMIQVVQNYQAYPSTYTSYGNIDFGTVKGMSVDYDLRRVNNVQLTASYTLQFADGTGSSSTSGASLVGTDQPNLRTTIPLSYDQRHAISTTFDYHYGKGKDYDGPVWFGSQVFSNAGANIVLRAGSGTPYSRQSNVTQEAASGINDRSVLDGSLNGSRLPWQFRINAKINKEFEIKWSEKKSSNLNVYLQVQNLLDAKNIISVYRATGNAEDDGYLTDAASQNAIGAQDNEEAFRYLYSLAVVNPDYFSLPRMWRAGLSLDF